MTIKNRERRNPSQQSSADDDLSGGDARVDGEQEPTAAAVDEALQMPQPADADIAGELSAANDRLLRLQAEMQNLRNRTSREIADERRYAALPVLRDLLAVVDNIDRAIEAAEKAGEAENLLEGFRLVRQQLATTLSRHQCEPIAAEGLPFDPNLHQAILQQPSTDVPAGNVMMVTQTGYKLHDRVVRPAQVIVSSGLPA
jgi:molecular chaperone GrpE